MIGADTIFLIQLKINELPRHKAKHELIFYHYILHLFYFAALLWVGTIRCFACRKKCRRENRALPMLRQSGLDAVE